MSVVNEIAQKKWHGSDCGGRKPNVKAFISLIMCVHVCGLSQSGYVTKNYRNTITTAKCDRGNNNNRPRHFSKLCEQQKMKYGSQHTAFNGIFMHNIIFSIRNILLLSAVFLSLSLFPLNVRHRLRRSKYFRRLHSVVILPFIYFSHWMECSIPNDTTKELYYLCCVATAAVATVLTTSNSQLLLLLLLLKLPFSFLFVAAFFRFLHFGFISSTTISSFLSFRVVSLLKFTAIRSHTDTHFHLNKTDGMWALNITIEKTAMGNERKNKVK